MTTTDRLTEIETLLRGELAVLRAAGFASTANAIAFKLADELAVVSQLQDERDALAEGFKRNLRLGTEEVRAERDAALERVSQLQDALREIVDFRVDPDDDPAYCFAEVRKIARAALAGVSPGSTKEAS